MSPRLTDELREAIKQHDGAPVRIDDDATQRSFVLLDFDEYCRLVDDRVRQEIEHGLAQVDRGEVEPWNVNEFLRKAHELHRQVNGQD